jgi:hypothetical protein
MIPVPSSAKKNKVFSSLDSIGCAGSKERYAQFVGFDKYFVSNMGNVKSDKTNRLLKIQTNLGYSTVGLNNINKRYCFLVHRLVAKAFIPNPENKLTVNHINHNTYDNRVENLEWNTSKEQNEHNYETETEKRQTNRARSVVCFDKLTKQQIKEFRSLSEASIWLNEICDSTNVASCLAGIRCSLNNGYCCKGYIWKYNDLENRDLDGEIWKEIPEELTCDKKNYWVSNKGRIKNDRGKIIEFKNHHQYISVSFRNKDKKATYQLHRLVAQLFIINPESKPIVNPDFPDVEIILRGKIDGVLKFADGTHSVIDFKTCEIQEKTLQKYVRQLSCYSYAMANPNSASDYSVKINDKIGLFVYEPNKFTIAEDGSANLGGKLKYIQYDLDLDGFADFIKKEVIPLIAGKEPAPTDDDPCWVYLKQFGFEYEED